MKRLLWLGAALALAGCGGADTEEVRQWMKQERAQVKPKVEPISEPKTFKPQAYMEQAALEPFSKEKLTQALRKDQGTTPASALLAPELERRKEPLEAYPLDAMMMVGSLLKQGQPVALLMVDKLLYQVRPGNYLGQNYGKITKVGETEVVLRELVQDAAGEWVERTATLQLQEKSK